MANIDRKGVHTRHAGNSAPSWQDYIDALKQEGARYRPASLTKALEKRDRPAGKPGERAKDVK